MIEEKYGCEIMNSEIPEETQASWLGRLSLDGVWRLIRCTVLRLRTTDQERQDLKDEGKLVEYNEQEWRDLANSAKYTAPEE